MLGKTIVTGVLSLGIAGLLATTGQAQQEKPAHLRGTITAAAADRITVKTREGETVAITVPAETRISGLAASSLSKVVKGSYVGIAAVPQAGGVLRAQEVLIFPPAMRGVGEGHRAWDLTPDSTMTNANVESRVSDVKGPMLTLTYKGGDKKVLVPAGTPVVTIVKGDRAMLKSGAHVFAVARKTGDRAYTALRIAVGVGGIKPPM